MTRGRRKAIPKPKDPLSLVDTPLIDQKVERFINSSIKNHNLWRRKHGQVERHRSPRTSSRWSVGPKEIINGVASEHRIKIDELEKRELTVEALELRKRGLPWTEIQKRLNMPRPWVQVGKLLHTVEFESIEEYRRLQSERLDALVAANWDKAMAGDVQSGTLIYRIEQFRSALLGTKAQVEVQEDKQPYLPVDIYRVMAERANNAETKIQEARKAIAAKSVVDGDYKDLDTQHDR